MILSDNSNETPTETNFSRNRKIWASNKLLVFAIVHHMSTVTHENTQMINNRIRCGNIVFMYIVQIHIYSYTCITYIILTFHVINIVYCCNVQLVVFYFFLNKEHELLNLNDPRASTIISYTSNTIYCNYHGPHSHNFWKWLSWEPWTWLISITRSA